MSRTIVLKKFYLLLVALPLVACTAQTPDAEAEGSKGLIDIPMDTSEIDRSDIRFSYAPMLKAATEAVVSVHTSRTVVTRNSGRSPMQDLLRRFYGIPIPDSSETIERRLPNGLGSGVIVDPSGIIITNYHVISVNRSERLADEILVQLNDGREFEAEVIGGDRDTDLAVLKIDAEALPSLPMANSDALQVGDVVFAVGNPLGVGLTVTQGIVSATGRSDLQIIGERSYENFIQTDASINPGNSGGALVDAQGRLIGINTAILSRTGGNIGIGFAIPSVLARNIALSLVNFGEIQRGFLGVSLDDLDQALAESFGGIAYRGALIQYVEDDTPAAQAGLKRGDIVTHLNGMPISGDEDLRSRIASRLPGTEIILKVVRDGDTIDVPVMLGDLSERIAQASTSAELLDGVTAEFVDDALREEFGIDEEVSGIFIRQIETSSPYVRSMSAGIIILEINGQAPTSVAQARDLFRSGINRLYVQAGDSYGFIAIRVP